jgi:hypothetical protein
MRSTVSAMLVLVLAAPLGLAQTTQPANATVDAAIELRATESFNKGDYAVALPMLQKLESDLKPDKSQADKVGMIQEQIRVCEKNTAPQSTPQATPAAPAQNIQVASAITSIGDTTALPVATPAALDPMSAAARKPHPTPKAGETLEMTIKELGNFEYDPEQNTPIPNDVKALSGHNIRLKGFMIPMDQAENISKFALVPSLFACCYGQPPQIQHTIVVTCPKGKAVSYYPDEIIVEGKLDVQVQKDDGFVVGIFSLETSSVKPAPK